MKKTMTRSNATKQKTKVLPAALQNISIKSNILCKYR